jgi:hypothetical protein
MLYFVFKLLSNYYICVLQLLHFTNNNFNSSGIFATGLSIYINNCLGRITSVNAAWPGAAHDSHILRSSNLAAYMQQHHRGKILHIYFKTSLMSY